MKTKFISTLTLAAVATVASTFTGIGSAQATTLASGSTDIIGGVSNYQGKNLSTATSVTFKALTTGYSQTGSLTVISDDGSDAWNIHIDGKSAKGFKISTVANSSIPLTGPSAFNIELSSYDNYGFEFTASKLDVSTVLNSNGKPNLNALNLEYTGTLEEISTGATQQATLQLGFTQAGGPGKAISVSGSLDPSVATPEPLTTAGAGLALGLGYLLKRKLNSVKKSK